MESAELEGLCTSKVVKIKKHLPFCKEFSILYIELELLLKGSVFDP